MQYKLVPVEPTDDMVIAFAETWYSKRQAYDDPDMLDAYRDMLAAAPVPVVQQRFCRKYLPAVFSHDDQCGDLVRGQRLQCDFCKGYDAAMRGEP